MAVLSADKVHQYFSLPRRNGIVGLIFLASLCSGVYAFVLGFDAGGLGFFAAGLVGLLIMAGLVKLWGMGKGGPKDADIEDTFAAKVEVFKRESIEALNIEASDLTRPIDFVWGPYAGDINTPSGTFPYHFRPGTDRVNRGNTRHFLLLLYGKDQVMTFAKAFNIEYDCYTHGATTEYFYRDVVSVDSNHSSFTLTTSGGTKVTVPLVGATGGEEGSRELANSTMNNIRAMLREKKAAA
jgi:hypothetical protein